MAHFIRDINSNNRFSSKSLHNTIQTSGLCAWLNKHPLANNGVSIALRNSGPFNKTSCKHRAHVYMRLATNHKGSMKLLELLRDCLKIDCQKTKVSSKGNLVISPHALNNIFNRLSTTKEGLSLLALISVDKEFNETARMIAVLALAWQPTSVENLKGAVALLEKQLDSKLTFLARSALLIRIAHITQSQAILTLYCQGTGNPCSPRTSFSHTTLSPASRG